MQISVFALVVSVVLTGLTTWIWRVLNWVWLRPKRLESYLKKQGLTGTAYTFVNGDAEKSSRMALEAIARPIGLTDDVSQRVLPFFVQMVKTYGKHSYSWKGPIPRVMVMDPELIKEVFNRVYDFPKPHINPLIKLFTGLSSYEGDKWAKHRKIINPAFHAEKLKNMVPSIYQSCSEMIRELEKTVSGEGSPHEVDVWPWLQKLTADIISRTAFGSNYNEARTVFELLKEQSKLSQQVIQTVYIPGWRFLPTKRNKRINKIDSEISSILKDITSKRERAMEAGVNQEDDLLGLLLESNSREDKARQMTIEEVIDECKLFYFAGQETTAVLLVWTMVLLGHHQEWQSRAREEVLRVIGEEMPDFDRLNHLKVVTMILYEVLRLYPPAVLFHRATSVDTKLEDITIPGGSIITIPVLLIHRDTDLWGPEAAEFKPGRFSEGVSKATRNRVSSFMPFTLGPRICIGQNFALMEAKIALAMILRRFTFDLSPSYAHAPYVHTTLHPQFGAQLKLRKL